MQVLTIGVVRDWFYVFFFTVLAAYFPFWEILNLSLAFAVCGERES